MIDHDRLFKELLTTFFVEFLDLFFPQVLDYLDQDSLIFLDKEIFTDVTFGERHESDLIVQAKFKGQDAYFLIHVEAQATNQSQFNQRMFHYFARLHAKFSLPVYPIVIFSYDRPLKPAPQEYCVNFPDLLVLDFKYRVLQLNQLHWRDFLSQPNPIASALMAKMQIAPPDRAKVKAECLRLLVTLKLDPARMQLISGFVDTYLTLNQAEETIFKETIAEFSPPEQEDVMQLTTSWMLQGIECGQKSLLLKQIKHRFGELDEVNLTRIDTLTVPQLEQLGEVLLDCSDFTELKQWLAAQAGTPERKI
ncbi:DUF4351 domain-containing protein [Synechocystis sp. LEGE 06083]|uniref:DUF4351 domain-containing protein n=1 Tax=Synechocystis sp. LEGE 06083 TaxID=915336 RepID=UPI0018800FA5|nr:DUF4351 domain-containing protein [Synechocystis sp. LEGE 06083]MBE9194588.1 DUF4351 domain-containing protein [Synechocystis sp. LEGE 06083]